MNGQNGSGLEVVPPSGLEQTVPSNLHLQDKYSHYDPSREGQTAESQQHQRSQTSRANKPERRWYGCRPYFWILAVIVVMCLAAAIGGGLGGGLASQRKGTASET